MHQSVTAQWRDHIVLTRDFVTPGERSGFFAGVRKGKFVAVFRGAYVRADIWLAMNRHERYRARVKAATAFAHRDLVFSHQSAAALWRLPWVGSWPDRVHVIAPVATGGRSKGMFARHTVGIPATSEEIDGVTVTSLARTVIDIARTASFRQAVAVADAALRRTEHPIAGVPRTFLTREDLANELVGIPLHQGVVKARYAIEFADGLAARPGESMSRVSMQIAGFPPPQLQVEIAGISGRVWIVDFWWPDLGLIGEFDGRIKYSDPEFLRGRTPEQALLDEKEREDDLRGTGRAMVRWRWDVAISPARLRETLERGAAVASAGAAGAAMRHFVHDAPAQTAASRTNGRIA